ncbi:MAG TPA: cytochrome D1 domain-containing protein [Accumulibacter sp.]|uniref:PQQ-dependent catabolism-associated beta-propeller protein n=1 Tax=Candidatus Accumulibacter cognatus TaxID=2954383 RepID=A0A080M427_9PROT|nr:MULTISPECIES: cytochrome D1 domain-containing protein [Candidatus Accumulibacter]KFB75210.1 MAG: PQQ-dependent catabolism-associated beta-propeller protein [Candidatus Accumulibacter cognatus]HMW56462.1 cytochrome D1 domain-containing protein [Accumulibacter sp.]HNF91488.1 cytochrome D1 domain-containing protein [Accumulibacter sp.]HNO13661.1 cytochrome D1 domain-containing protein [Accumulibacter sp.]HNO73194.1 cytochrome D1 domain-containing protein [Accumulibacter sp.]
MKRLWTLLSMVLLAGCTTPTLRGSADLGVVIERASGQLSLVDTSRREVYARIGGLGDLSHASVVFARDGRYAYVFGRDGGLSKVDLLEARIVKRVLQSGNAIGGAISQDGRIVVAQNYTPGGIKAFDAETLELLSEVPAEYAPGNFSKVVGLADLAGQRFAYALFDGGEVWISDFSDPRQPQTQRYPAGLQPYDGLVTPDGRHYLAGLFGEDGVALLDTWRSEQGTRRILGNYGRGEEKLPVFKMPHLRGWSMAQGNAYLPAIGRHEVLVVAGSNWQEIAHIAVKGQPVFVMARPDGRQVWVNYAFPDNGWVEVIDTLSGKIVKTLAPGRAILHMEFTPRGEQVWISARDDNRVLIYDTATFTKLGELEVQAPSGIFFTSRANRMGF